MATSSKLLTNLIWRLAERSGAQLVAFIVSIILARVLEPSDYGTITMITVFTAILQVFVDSGLGNALIQKKDADDIDFSTVFYTNIAFCTILYILICFCAPLLADFYNIPSMTWMIRVLGLTVLISGVKNVQQAYVSRNMMFKKFFFSTLSGTIGAAVVGIVMAYKGFGAWALVVQQVLNLTVDTIILWISVGWRPKKMFSFFRLKSLYTYGWKLLISSLLDTVYNNLRSLIIGKIYSTSDLAYYNQGQRIPNIIVTNINTSIDSVLFPAMSNIQDDTLHIKCMTRQSIKISVYVMAPLMMGLVFIAEPLVDLLLTEKWMFCIPYLRIFCITYMFYPIHTANLNAIKALGRSDLFLKLEIYKKIIGMVLLVITMWLGVKAMAYSLLISSICSQIINSWPNKKLLNYSYVEQLKDIMPSILLAVTMGTVVYQIHLFRFTNTITLVLQIILSIIIYIGGSLLFKLDSFYYLYNIVQTYYKKIRKI